MKKTILGFVVAFVAFTAGARGDDVNAHGGWWLEEGGRVYWYGEHKVEGTLGNTAQVGVHVYSRAVGESGWRRHVETATSANGVFTIAFRRSAPLPHRRRDANSKEHFFRRFVKCYSPG